jgi:hypothetical protein
MRRTSTTCFHPELTAPAAAVQTGHVPHVALRLQWTVRNGRLMSRWRTEARDLAEGDARGASRAAA